MTIKFDKFEGYCFGNYFHFLFFPFFQWNHGTIWAILLNISKVLLHKRVILLLRKRLSYISFPRNFIKYSQLLLFLGLLDDQQKTIRHRRQLLKCLKPWQEHSCTRFDFHKCLRYFLKITATSFEKVPLTSEWHFYHPSPVLYSTSNRKTCHMKPSQVVIDWFHYIVCLDNICFIPKLSITQKAMC